MIPSLAENMVTAKQQIVPIINNCADDCHEISHQNPIKVRKNEIIRIIKNRSHSNSELQVSIEQFVLSCHAIRVVSSALAPNKAGSHPEVWNPDLKQNEFTHQNLERKSEIKIFLRNHVQRQLEIALLEPIGPASLQRLR